MKKLIIIIILILFPYNISFGESVPADSMKFVVVTKRTDFVEFDCKPREFGDLLSFDLVRMYDTSMVHNGYYILVFRKENFTYDIDNSGGVDIADLVEMIDYMFGSPQ